jgi:hypothetical protein
MEQVKCDHIKRLITLGGFYCFYIKPVLEKKVVAWIWGLNMLLGEASAILQKSFYFFTQHDDIFSF